MGKGKEPRHVALAIVLDPATHKILMITSRKHPRLWILPKGGIEDGETSGQAAVREAYEEAGTPETLDVPSDGERLMMLALEPAKSQKRGAVWHVHVLKTSESSLLTDWPEKHERQRAWYTTQECLDKIKEWYSDPTTAEEMEGDAEEIAPGKKDRKGGAMETALRAFAEHYGWDRQLV